jgi:hypothetical protein
MSQLDVANTVSETVPGLSVNDLISIAKQQNVG